MAGAPPGRAGPGLLTSGGRQVPADAGLGPAGSRWRRAGGAGRRARAVRPAARLPLGNRGQTRLRRRQRPGRSGGAGGQGRWLGAHAGAGPAGQARDGRGSPGCRGARPPPAADRLRLSPGGNRQAQKFLAGGRALFAPGARHTRRGGGAGGAFPARGPRGPAPIPAPPRAAGAERGWGIRAPGCGQRVGEDGSEDAGPL